jgi:hypothetical protein
MMECLWRFLLSKGAGQTDWYFFLCYGIQIGIAMRGQLWDYTDFSFCYIWATSSDWDCMWAWCSWIIHGGVLAGYVNLTVSIY